MFEIEQTFNQIKSTNGSDENFIIQNMINKYNSIIQIKTHISSLQIISEVGGESWRFLSIRTFCNTSSSLKFS